MAAGLLNDIGGSMGEKGRRIPLRFAPFKKHGTLNDLMEGAL